MGFTVSQVLEFVKENDVKFIRLAFCNLLGMQKNIAIMAQELPRAFESGICIDTSAAAGFVPGESHDILLFPDPDTLTILPWRPSQGRVVRMGCEMLYADGTPYPGDGRALLDYKGIVSHSRWAWRLKDRIDRRFMARYQRLG